MPFYVVGKEISLEDVRLTLQKMSDRFFEHPATVLVLTNLAYADAPWLHVKSLNAASSLVWHELPLLGNSAHRFEQQIIDLEPFLAQNWKAGVVAAHRQSDLRAAGGARASIARTTASCSIRSFRSPAAPSPITTSSSPRSPIAPARSLEFKAKRVIAPLARALGPGGRLIAIHSHGHDPGMEIIQRVWPDDNPFIHDRHRSSKRSSTNSARPAASSTSTPMPTTARCSATTCIRCRRKSPNRSAPRRCSRPGTRRSMWRRSRTTASATVAADGSYIDATRAVLRERGGLWFFDEVLRDFAAAGLRRLILFLCNLRQRTPYKLPQRERSV